MIYEDSINKKFDITKVPRDEKKKSLINPILPTSSFLIIAKTDSGKTNLLCNLFLKKSSGFLDEYQKIYIFSPTALLDDSFDILNQNEQIEVIPEYDEIRIEQIMDDNAISVEKENNDKYNKKIKKKINILLIKF
jgi:hypothetical protein